MRGVIAAGAALVTLVAVPGCSSSSASDAAAELSATSAAAPAGSAASSAPPPDGGTYGAASDIEAALDRGGQDCAPGVVPDVSDFDGATDAAMCSSPNAPSQDTTVIVFRTHDQAAAYAGTAVVALDGMIPTTTAVLGVNWVLTTTSSTFAQTAQGILGGTVEAPKAAPSPTPAATRAPEQVTYHCEGHGGVNITYGPSGSQHSSSHLPFTHTDPLTQGALYYATTAQLQGGGSVSCTTTVQTDDLLGYAQSVSNSGSADGGYNIATAEVCSGIDGWEKC